MKSTRSELAKSYRSLRLPTHARSWSVHVRLISHGMSRDALSPILIAAITWTCGRFCLRTVDPACLPLFVATGIGLWVSFHLWHPLEYSPLNPDITGEFPHLAGLAYGFAMGGLVVLERAEKEEPPPPSSWKEWIRELGKMRHYWIPFSAITAGGYTFFLIHAHAMHQIFAHGNYLFIALTVCALTVFLAFACKQAKTRVIKRTPNQ